MEPITMIAEESLQFGEDIQHLMAPPENASSFTALLGLPATKALELLHLPESSESPATLSVKPQMEVIHKQSYFHSFNNASLAFPSNVLTERAAVENINSPETSASVISKQMVKNEPAETESNPNSSQLLVSNPTEENKSQISAKRKERVKKGKGSSKKSKSENPEETEKLPYVHVRARRGQATDSHSLAERARREKINARMKLLQELVPGCNKITGTALVLDEIINHVQSLQRQVEFLSMRLAAANPTIDFDLDGVFACESASLVNCNFPGIGMPPSWPEVQINGNRQQYQPQIHLDSLHQPVWGRDDGHQNFVTPENSLLSYDSSANSVSLRSNQVKMEL